MSSARGVAAFDFEFTGPLLQHETYAVGWAFVRDGTIVSKGKLFCKPTLEPGTFSADTLTWIQSNEVTSLQLIHAKEHGLAPSEFNQKLREVVQQCHNDGFRIIADLPFDLTRLVYHCHSIPLHVTESGDFIGGPFVTDDFYRAKLKTLDTWGLDAQMDALIGFTPPKSNAHDPEDDAVEIALRFDAFLRFESMYPATEPDTKKQKIEE